MPELPEVQTVVNLLKPKLINLKINSVKITYRKLVKPPYSSAQAEEILANKKIVDIFRIGKYIIFDLENIVMISHLRMEGRWYVVENDQILDKEKHVEAIFKLSNNTDLKYLDSRKFGTLNIQEKSTFLTQLPISKIALDPLDNNIDVNTVFSKLNKTSRHIKTALLDQTIIAGIGNIYADEILFMSKIDPLRMSKNINMDECKDIVDNSKKVLKHAIELGGSTISSYHPTIDKSGEYQNHLKVHLRKGQKCFICGTIILKIKVNGRGTYYCSSCQK